MYFMVMKNPVVIQNNDNSDTGLVINRSSLCWNVVEGKLFFILNKCADNFLSVVTELPRKRRLSEPTGNSHSSGTRTTSRIQMKRRRRRRSSSTSLRLKRFSLTQVRSVSAAVSVESCYCQSPAKCQASEELLWAARYLLFCPRRSGPSLFYRASFFISVEWF